MSFAIFSIYLLSLASAFLLGNTAAAGAAVLEGAADALRFAMELAGALCLWSAVTPAGIRAAKGLSRLAAEKELHLLVVVNTASIQLLPTTAASVRASLGSAAPFDITGAVWVSSALSLLAGLAAIRLLDGGKA